ncbi:MAG: hypothetical protein AAGA64_01000 [Bacteroidota bacterium]
MQQRDEALVNPDRVRIGYVGSHRHDAINTQLCAARNEHQFRDYISGDRTGL